MSQLLHIDCSIRREESYSRRLSRKFVDRWQMLHPDATLVYRDLAADPLPMLSEAAVSGMFLPEEVRTPEMKAGLALSDLVVDEFLASDRILIATPMYNFHVPPTLKNWFDHVTRAGRTFKFTEEGAVGLAGGRKVIIISVRGGYYGEGSPNQEADLQTPWLRLMFGFMGIGDVELIRCEATNIGGQLHEASLAAAEARLEHILTSW
ncbi:MAG: FMN-dependent NADH-azoreductase [Armatimonadetes bacterium]|nr:FMN-dependent NADH-azoreductase [Armatimonadota bacterium]